MQSEAHKCRMKFGDRRIFLDYNPRIGKCSQCGRKIGEDIKKTHMHHAEGYSHDDPLYGTIELCVRCHKRAHMKPFDRKCLECGITTSIHKQWYRFDGGYRCHLCYGRYRYLSKKVNSHI